MNPSEIFETVDDLRSLDIFEEAKRYRDCANGVDSLSRAVLIGADVLRRTLIAVHDSLRSQQEYNP